MSFPKKVWLRQSPHKKTIKKYFNNNKKGIYIKLRQMNGNGTGNGNGLERKQMQERIVFFKKSIRKGKKYTAYLQNKKTKKIRQLSFGALGYEQYKDRTPLQLYAAKNHGDKKRQRNYYTRHSGIPDRLAAIQKEIRHSHGYYTPKILSHEYLWG